MTDGVTDWQMQEGGDKYTENESDRGRMAVRDRDGSEETESDEERVRATEKG